MKKNTPMVELEELQKIQDEGKVQEQEVKDMEREVDQFWNEVKLEEARKVVKTHGNVGRK